MLKQDYIERMIEELAEGLQRVAQLRRDGKLARAEDSLAEIAKHLSGLELSTLEKTPAMSVFDLVREDEIAALLACAIAQHGELLTAAHHEERGLRARRKAFVILDELERRGALPDFELVRGVLTELINQL